MHDDAKLRRTTDRAAGGDAGGGAGGAGARGSAGRSLRRLRALAAERVPPQPLHTMLKVVCGASGVRREIMFKLAERPRDVGTLVGDVDLDQATVSHHLAELRRVGVVVARSERGRRVYEVGGNARVMAEEAAAGALEVGRGRVAIELTGSDDFVATIEKRPPGDVTAKIPTSLAKSREIDAHANGTVGGQSAGSSQQIAPEVHVVPRRGRATRPK